MSPLADRGIARAALTVVLALATQFAFAGQVCRAVMVDGMAENRPAQVLPRASDVPQPPVADLQPCCDGDAMAASNCFLAMLGTESVVALAAGAAPLFDLAPPRQDWSTVAVGDTSSAAVLLPTGLVGPPLPAYLLFHRFLS
jgi:hypothetical protein